MSWLASADRQGMPSEFSEWLSVVPGVAWPAIPSERGALLAALLFHLERSEWSSPERLADHQAGQLAHLLDHCRRHSAFHRERLPPDNPAGASLAVQGLAEFPFLTRSHLQERPDDLVTEAPADHGPWALGHSSGSTGRMVAVRRTAFCRLIWEALVLREHYWHRRDFTGTLAVTRANLGFAGGPPRISQSDWGPPVAELHPSGPAHGISLRTDVATQADWLAAIDPDYLLTYPTNLSALLDRIEARGNPLRRLRQVRTIGETLPAGLAERCRSALNVGIADVYSAEEVGMIAVQCPLSGLYHVQADNLLVEVLDGDDRPCGDGEVGRVVITDLHNFAMPLIRYDIGDHAEVAGPCPCGRGLPAWRRILGRTRNMVVLPDGRRYWPLTGAYFYRDVAPIRQYQVVQRDLATLVLRYAADDPLTAAQEAALTPIVREAIGHPFAVAFEFCPGEIPKSAGGKFEEFVCLVNEDPTA